MARIIQLTKFSGQDGASQLANLKMYRCDSVIYCKSQAEATCYRVMIEHFAGSRKGVDHLCGNIAICVDPTSTMIEGMHLVALRIPGHIKSSYPFQLQAKKIGEENLAKILEVCGLKTEKELKAVWERCANRLTFPIEASADEKNDYAAMFKTAKAILQDVNDAQNKQNVEEVKQAEEVITNWMRGKFGEKFQQSPYYSWKTTWRATHPVDNYRSYMFCIEMDHSQTKGVESLIVSFSGLSLSFTLPWLQDNKNMSVVLSRLDMMWEQFNVMMTAVTKTVNAASVNLTAVK